MGKEGYRQRAINELPRLLETAVSLNLYTAERRANEQPIVMDSFLYNATHAEYYPVLGCRQHQLGPMPEMATGVFQAGRALIYESNHSSEETLFRFGRKIVKPQTDFRAITYVGPVTPDNSLVERFVIRADCLTNDQINQVIFLMIDYPNSEGRKEGSELVSCNKDFDPFGEDSPLAEAIEKVVGENNLNDKHKELIAVLKGQSKTRLETHSTDRNNFELELIFLGDINKFAVFDQVLKRYVLWEETTSDANSLKLIDEAQWQTREYLLDPNPNKLPLNISMAFELSGRTAGKRKDPSGVESNINIDPSGRGRQNSQLKPLDQIDPRLFDNPISNWVSPTSIDPLVTPVLPIPIMSVFPRIPSIGQTGGGNIIGGSILTSFEDPTVISSRSAADYLGMVFAAPAIYDLAVLTTTLSTAITTEFIANGVIESVNPLIESTESGASTVIVNDLFPNIDSDEVLPLIPGSSNWVPSEGENSPDFPPEPDFPPVIPVLGGGGGIALPQKIKTVWDYRMKERFEEVNKPKVLYEAVVPQNNHTETVVFETKKVDVKNEVATRFYEYASTIEVVSVEVPEDIPLLVSSPQQEEITEAKINNKNLEVDFVCEEEKRDMVVNIEAKGMFFPNQPQPQIMPRSLAEIFLYSKNVIEQKELNSPLQQFMNQVMQNMPVVNVGAELKEDLQFERPVGVRQKKTNIKTKIKIRPSLSFLALLFLTKIKLQSAINTRFLLFLLNPKLFLIPATTKI